MVLKSSVLVLGLAELSSRLPLVLTLRLTENIARVASDYFMKALV